MRESKECNLFKSKLSCLLQCVDRKQRWQVHVGESAHHDGSQVCTQMAAGTGNTKQALTENQSFQICNLKKKKNCNPTLPIVYVHLHMFVPVYRK